MKKLSLFLVAFMLLGLIMKAQQNSGDKNRHFKLNAEKPANLHRDYNNIEQIGLLLQKKESKAQQYLIDSMYNFHWGAASNNWETSPYNRGIYSYDNSLNTAGYTSYFWDLAKNKFIVSFEYKYVYDGNGNMTEWIQNDWDTVTNSWIPVEHDTLVYSNNVIVKESWNFYNPLNHTWFTGYYFQYNNNGALLESYSFWWDDLTFAIISGNKMTNTLNSQDNPVETLYQDFDTITHSWINSAKTASTYQNDTTLVNDLNFTWNNTGSTWDTSDQSLYYYTGNLNNEVITQYWDGTAWINSSRRTYEYNASQSITKDLFQLWNSVSWDNYNQTLNTYNSNNQVTEKWYQNFVNNNWVNSRFYGYSYDNNGNQTERVYQIWLASTGAIYSGYDYLYTYDNNNMLTEAIYKLWNPTTVDWQNNVKAMYYSSLHNTFVNNLNGSNGATIYPNPVNNILYFENILPGAMVSIYDSHGKILMNEKISYDQTDVSSLPDGFYFVRIASGKEISVRKLVKQ